MGFARCNRCVALGVLGVGSGWPSVSALQPSVADFTRLCAIAGNDDAIGSLS